MKMEQNEGGAPDGIHTSRHHDWGNPVGGAGSMKVCKKCGEKLTDYTNRAECVGRPSTGIVETTHDYNPIG
jgi:hypothetical protein